MGVQGLCAARIRQHVAVVSPAPWLSALRRALGADRRGARHVCPRFVLLCLAGNGAVDEARFATRGQGHVVLMPRPRVPNISLRPREKLQHAGPAVWFSILAAGVRWTPSRSLEGVRRTARPLLEVCSAWVALLAGGRQIVRSRHVARRRLEVCSAWCTLGQVARPSACCRGLFRLRACCLTRSALCCPCLSWGWGACRRSL